MTNTASKAADEKYCSECGAIIKAKAEICPQCGVRQLSVPCQLNMLAPNGKSRLAAALFAIFLGGIGVHKFYLGQMGWGILYILFCWTGIPVIAGAIEGVLLLVMRQEDFNRKYGYS